MLHDSSCPPRYSPRVNINLRGRRLAALFGVLAMLSLTAGPAEAHRSGCHRWRTCPSDTGSYTMGTAPLNVPPPPVNRTGSGGGYSGGTGYMGDMWMTNVNANLRAAGSTSARILKVIPRSTLVEVYMCTGSWCKVKANGTIGWLALSTMTR